MIRLLKTVVLGVALLPFLGVTALLLFWLGRAEPPVSEVFSEFDDNDPGEDVDERNK